MKRVLKWLAVALLATTIGLAAAFGPAGFSSLGARPAGDRLERMQQSPEWRDGKFRNYNPLWTDERGALFRSFSASPYIRPDEPVDVAHPAGGFYRSPPSSGLRITWFGHSATLIEIDGIAVLTDPTWSERTSPVSWAGPSRFFLPPVAIADLPPISAVLISHDHYDHLDRNSVIALGKIATRFIVPLGVGADLTAWGVPEDRITELDWWQSTTIDGVEITATPARHATGRVVPDGDKTLWAGYALRSPSHRVYYSGDTGLFPAMSDIGERLGPFDVALIEAGQYDATWPDWHLGPEQAVEANRMVRGKVMIPVHWALFRLAQHGWTEPAERVLAAARCQGVDVLIPRPGQPVDPTDTTLHIPRWWPNEPWETATEHPVIATRNGDPKDRVTPPACAPS